jgi:hypothetical protein
MAVFWVVASTSETSVNFYQTARRYNPEDSHLHTCRRENLKSHRILFVTFYNVRTFDSKILIIQYTLL